MDSKIEPSLQETNWDYVVVGNGVSALWVAHWLWTTKKTVLWVTSDEPFSSSRAWLQHGWHWGLPVAQYQKLSGAIPGFADEEVKPFEVIYYDARSSKRFRQFGEIKQVFGKHEKLYFKRLTELLERKDLVDVWGWHSRLHAFHDSGVSPAPTTIELFKDPRFVRTQGYPLLEIKTSTGKIEKIVLSGLKPTESIEISGQNFILGDFDEFFPLLIKNDEDREKATPPFKGKTYRAGFSLKLWHKELGAAPTQTVIIPLIANPAKDSEASHVIGRFINQNGKLESYWMCLLTNEEVEDNNEILKKIKLTKRAIERAIPGFSESILREAVTFEPRLCSLDEGQLFDKVLNSLLVTDQRGPEEIIRFLADSNESSHDEHVQEKSPNP
ncbi:MAG: hypothetical protein AB7F43_10130 [Bacteriovoracia bacterium]